MTTTLQTISASQTQKEVPANENFEALAPAALFARRSAATSGLTWAYYGGEMWVGGTLTAIADGTVTLANGSPDAVNYVEATTAGVVSANTTGFTAGRIPLYVVTVTSGQVSSYVDKRTSGIGGSVLLASATEAIIVACSDEVSEITTATGVTSFRMPYAFTLTAVRASLTVAPEVGSPGGLLIVDINESGTTILSTKLSIDAGERTSTTAATAAVISDSALADDAEITIDVDQGSVGARGLKVYLIGTKA